MKQTGSNIISLTGTILYRTICVMLLGAVLLSANVFNDVLEYLQLDNIEMSEGWENEMEEEKKEGSEDNESDKILNALLKLSFKYKELSRDVSVYQLACPFHAVEILTPPPEFV